MWEIAENVHRSELTALERSKHFAEWLRLGDKLAQVEPFLGGRENEGGVRKAARELSLEKEDARRAVIVDRIAPDAKEAAREVGLDDNRYARRDPGF